MIFKTGQTSTPRSCTFCRPIKKAELLPRTGRADLIKAAGMLVSPPGKPDTCLQTVLRHKRKLAKSVGSIHAENVF